MKYLTLILFLAGLVSFGLFIGEATNQNIILGVFWCIVTAALWLWSYFAKEDNKA